MALNAYTILITSVASNIVMLENLNVFSIAVPT